MTSRIHTGQALHEIENVPAGLFHGARVTIGNFDGVHRGHQHLIDSLKPVPGGPLVVITFWPHPAKVLKPEMAPITITPQRLKDELLAAAGADLVLCQTFDKALASHSAADFFERFLAGPIKASTIHVGYDFTFGKNREGTFDRLKELATAHGVAVAQIPALRVDGVVVSSTLVREKLLSGRVRIASQLLGRPHEIRGVVVKGDQRGRTIGFPTANLGETEGLIPALGVYACRARVSRDGGQTFEPTMEAVTNVGHRPTFGDRGMAVEVHMLGFAGDLYGAVVDLAFVRRIRAERRFESVQALVAQIGSDTHTARNMLEEAAKGHPDYAQARW
jgi:riboflavin kinase / FMN adenylyltransferase